MSRRPRPVRRQRPGFVLPEPEPDPLGLIGPPIWKAVLHYAGLGGLGRDGIQHCVQCQYPLLDHSASPRNLVGDVVDEAGVRVLGFRPGPVTVIVPPREPPTDTLPLQTVAGHIPGAKPCTLTDEEWDYVAGSTRYPDR